MEIIIIEYYNIHIFLKWETRSSQQLKGMREGVGGLEEEDEETIQQTTNKQKKV